MIVEEKERSREEARVICSFFSAIAHSTKYSWPAFASALSFVAVLATVSELATAQEDDNEDEDLALVLFVSELLDPICGNFLISWWFASLSCLRGKEGSEGLE